MGPVVDATKANQAEPILILRQYRLARVIKHSSHLEVTPDSVLAPISYPLAMCARPHMPNEFRCALAKRTKSSKSTDLRQAGRLTPHIHSA